jgi:CubicO group peptidase (beta-lactamase class C family)
MAIPQDDPALCGLAWAAKVMASGKAYTGRDPLAVFRESCNWMAAPDDMMRAVRETGDPRPLLALAPELTWGGDALGVSLDGRTAWVKRFAAQGFCVVDGPEAQPHFTPTTGVAPPDISCAPWPQGDACEADPGCTGAEVAALRAAEDLAFANARQMTNALLVLHRGRILLERYRAPFDRTTQFESWSMGKTIAATLVGVALNQGLLDLDEPCNFDAWRGDARAAITPRHLLNMASGLAFTGSYGHSEDNLTKQQDGRFLDHIYVYAGGVNSFAFCVNKPQQDAPGKAGRYRNCDPILATALVREKACGGDVQRFLDWPYRALLHRIGAVGMLLETDPFGHFLISGHDYGRARDWARLGQLHLQRGAWEGEQLFSEAFAEFVRTPAAEAWRDDPTYGGFVYVNATGHFPTLPKDAFVMSGGGRQRVVVVPSKDLVIVRLGHINGMMAGVDETLNAVYGQILSALPA